MNRAILRKAIADLRTYRFQTALVFTILVAATATLMLAVSVRLSADRPWERAFDQSNGAHVTFTTFRNVGNHDAADLTRIASQTGVSASSGPYTGALGQSLVTGGDKRSVTILAPDQLPEVSQPIITGGRWLDGTEDEVVLDRALARLIDIEPGDIVSIHTDAGLHELRVAGIAILPWREPYPDGDALVYTTGATLDSIVPSRVDRATMLFVRLDDPGQARTVAMQTSLRQPGTFIASDNWIDVRDEFAYWNQINASFLGLFSAFALVAAGLIVANIISARVLAQYRDIGLLKAVGFTPGQVTQLFLLEYLLVGLVAGVVGIAIGTALAPIFLNDLAESMQTTALPALDPLAAVAVLLVLLVVVTAFTVLPSARGGRIPTMQAIASGFANPGVRPSRLARAATRLRVPVIVTLGLKDAFARPWRAAMSVVALVLTVMTVIFALAMNATFNRVFDDPALQGEPWDLVVRRNDIDDSVAQRILAENPDVRSFHTRSIAMATLETPTTSGQSTTLMPMSFPGAAAGFGVRALGGDVEDAGYIIKRGRMFSGPNEAVAGWGLFRDLGVQVGDSVNVSIDGEDISLTLVGEYFEDDDNGVIAMISMETLGRARSDVTPMSYLVRLREPDAYEHVASALTIASDYEFGVWTPADEAEGDREVKGLGTVMFGLSVLLLVIGLINLLATTLLTVRERVRDYGIFKTLGLTPRQIVVSVLSGVGFIALIAAVVGIPVGLLVYRFFYRVIAEAELGAVPGWYTVPSFWTLALLLPGAVIVAAIAGGIPALQVARMEASRVLRYE